MLEFKKEQCTGCGACNNACPIECINMVQDEEGFLYPEIDIKRCTNCGICESSCPILNRPKNYNRDVPKVYAAWSLNEKTRYESSSGGIFTELAGLIINRGGYVSGALCNESNMVEHCVINSIDYLPKLRQSKYVQSKVGRTYTTIKILLDKGETVMFVGTPCQNGGLLGFLNKRYDNLLLCDLVCHGVNSPMIYSRYFNELEEEYKSKIKTINFRDKRNGWKDFGTCVMFENGREYYSSSKTEPFYRGFMKNLYLRPSCYNCQYKSFPRFSNLTFADFWGITPDNASDDIYMGVSLIMSHSQKGDKYFESLNGEIVKKSKTLEEALLHNPCIVKSSYVQNEKRDNFFKSLISEKKLKSIIKQIIAKD